MAARISASCLIARVAVEAVTITMARNAMEDGIRPYIWNAAHKERYNTPTPTAFSE